MKDYLKLAVIVLLFIAGSAVESHADPYNNDLYGYHNGQPAKWTQEYRQNKVNARRAADARNQRQRQQYRQTRQQLNRIEYNTQYGYR